RWVSRKRPNPVGVQECEASSNAPGHAVAQCFHPGDAKSPEPRGMRRSRWPIVSSLYCETLTLSITERVLRPGRQINMRENCRKLIRCLTHPATTFAALAALVI